MASRLVSLLVVAAICAVALQSATARQIYGNDNWVQNSAVHKILATLIPGKNILPKVDDATALKYLNLASCFNGTFALLKDECEQGHCDLPEQPLYKTCLENRDNLLQAYLVGFGMLSGSAIVLPVHFYKEFTRFVILQDLDERAVEKNLVLFPGTWEFQNRTWHYIEYCERMVELVDDELSYWGYNDQLVADFFALRTKLPVGKALELCRKRLQL